MSDVAPPGTIAAEYLPDLSPLTRDQRATFRVGQIVRLSVVMESTAHDIHALLQDGWPDDVRPGPQSFSALKSEIRDMLRRRKFPLLDDAGQALEEVYDVYRERNRYAHDALIERDRDVWRRVSIEHAEQRKYEKDVDKQQLTAAVLDVITAQWRLHALHTLVDGWRGGVPTADVKPSDVFIRDGWVAILAGEFTLTPAGGVSITREL